MPAQCYAASVVRSAACRRLIAVIALLCQVAMAAHAPMLQASSTGGSDNVTERCAGHAQHAPGIDHPATLTTNPARHPGHTGACGRGLCQCSCAQGPAAVCALSMPPAAGRAPVTIPYRIPDVPQPTTAFFRPPI